MTITARIGTTGLVAVFILASAALSAVTAAPRADASDPAQEIARMRAAGAANADRLVTQQGGARLVLKVDAAASQEAMVTELRDELYKVVREGRVPHAGLAIRDGGVDIKIADAGKRQQAVSKAIAAIDAASLHPGSVSAAEGGDGLVRLTPTESGIAWRLHGLVGQSIDLIEQVLGSNGMKLAGVRPDGSDRIGVVLPGVADPDRVAALLTRKAQVAFRMVDVSVSVAQAQQTLPPDSELVPDFKDATAPHLLLKQVAMDGDDLVEAAPGFGENRQPIANFRFNARGARRLAQITSDNIGRPFAVVVDGRVVSDAVIREPITGGSGVISGNFTLAEANAIAMLMRSGTLAGRLSVVDRQVVAASGAGK